MSENDVGRRTPYEVVFGDARFEGTEFPSIVREAEERGLDIGSRQEFALIGRVGLLLDELVPDESDPAALEHYLDLLSHAVAFWRADRPVYAFGESVVRSLIEESTDDPGGAPPPAAALYVELPRTLFWAAAVEDAPPEPVEGIFVRTPEGRSARVDCLLVLGMRPDRPGFSVAATTVEMTRGPPAEEEPFRSDIPGAELAGIYSLTTPAEIAVLLRRLFARVRDAPRDVEFVRGGSVDAGEAQGGAASGPTRLDHFRTTESRGTR